MHRYNSTIRVKTGQCDMCPPGSPDRPLIKGKCEYHYQLASKMKSLAKQSEKEVKADPGFEDLVNILDSVVSKYLRHSNANKDGLCTCYTCDSKIPIAEAQAGHYIKRRASMYLRWDITRNLRVQCSDCNERLDGNYPEYTRRLELELPGVTEILLEEAHGVHKWSKEELRSMITEYRIKLKNLQK